VVRGEVACGSCGAMVAIEMSQQPSIINLEFASVMIMEHSGQASCPSCGITIVPAIAGIAGLMLKLCPVATSKQRLIVPGTTIPI
jgi:ribosomal protein S27E